MCKCTSKFDVSRFPGMTTTMTEIEGDSPFESPVRFAMIALIQPRRGGDGAATPAELRILRQGPAAGRNGRADLQLRVHVLRGLRRDQAAQCLPELRRRFRAAADPARERMAARAIGREATSFGQACSSQLQPRRHRRAFGENSEYSTWGSLSCLYSVIARSESDEAISSSSGSLDCFASLAMTTVTQPPQSSPRPRQNQRDNRRPGTSRA